MTTLASGTRMSRRSARRRATAIVAITMLVALLGAGSALTAGPDDRLMLRASFTDASPLLEGNDVRLGGVKVGQIASMRTTGEVAEVTLELEKEALPLHTDARLTIRPVSLLGERYIDLERGSPDAPVLADGAHLGVSRTGSSVDLDEVLNSVDDPAAAGLAAIVGTLGQGLDGNGDDVRRALKALEPALRDTGALTRTLREQNVVLNSLVTSLEPVASGLAAGDGSEMDRLVAAAVTMLRQTRVHEQAFRDTLAELPGTLREARATLAALEGTAEAATPTLKALRPTTSKLDEISGELLAFAEAADPALKAANPVLVEAERLVANARPVARLMRQTSPAALADVRNLDPITRSLTADLTAVMDYIRGWALTTNGRDGLSHYFRANLILSEFALTGQLPGGSGTTAGGQAGEDGTGQLGGLLDNPLDDVGGLLDTTLSPATDEDGGVTGLTSDQEAGLLSQLLGGSS